MISISTVEAYIDHAIRDDRFRYTHWAFYIEQSHLSWVISCIIKSVL